MISSRTVLGHFKTRQTFGGVCSFETTLVAFKLLSFVCLRSLNQDMVQQWSMSKLLSVYETGADGGFYFHGVHIFRVIPNKFCWKIKNICENLSVTYLRFFTIYGNRFFMGEGVLRSTKVHMEMKVQLKIKSVQCSPHVEWTYYFDRVLRACFKALEAKVVWYYLNSFAVEAFLVHTCSNLCLNCARQ